MWICLTFFFYKLLANYYIMKEKVQKMAEKACYDLNKGIENEDVHMIISSIQFLDRTCTAYLGYLQVLKYADTDNAE